MDRVFEDLQLAVRLSRSKLQFYALDGERITQWYEIELSEDLSQLLWKTVEEANLGALKEEYHPAPQTPGSPPLLREVDELVVRLQSPTSERVIRVLYRPEGPESLTRLVQTLEQTALTKGERRAKVHKALLAKDLDIRNYPRHETVATTLRRKGTTFFEASEAWLEKNSSVLEALETPGWLVPTEANDLPHDLVLPAYLRAWGHYHFQIMVHPVTLVEHSLHE